MSRTNCIMEKYKKGRDIEPADFEFLREAASVGNVGFGFTIRDGEIIPQAKLTDSGKFFLKLDKRSTVGKIFRWFSAVFNSVF